MNKAPSSQITPDQDAIVGEVEIDAPPDRVFRALTDPAQLIRWWSDDICKTSLWEMDARKGGKWRFEASDPSGKIVVNGVTDFKAYGELTEFDPPRLLAYTWLGNWHDHPERPSVHGTLGAVGDQVRHPGQGYSPRPSRPTGCPQGLRGWLAWIARIAWKILRIRNEETVHGDQCSYSRQRRGCGGSFHSSATGACVPGNHRSQPDAPMVGTTRLVPRH
jgi:uncharacterized protein YndB with AHSA1/START domain